MELISKQAAQALARDRVAQDLIRAACDFLRGSSWRMSIHGQVQSLAHAIDLFEEAHCDDAFPEILDEEYHPIANKGYDPEKQRKLRESAYTLADKLFSVSKQIQQTLDLELLATGMRLKSPNSEEAASDETVS